MDRKIDTTDSNPENRDPITEEPGSHPWARESGPPGAPPPERRSERESAGLSVPSSEARSARLPGGAAGHAAGEAVNPTVEAEYWRQNYNKRPYYMTGKAYSEYEPAYRYGWESAARPEYRGRKFQEVESDLEKGWEKTKGKTAQSWHEVKDATRDAWDRIRT